MERLERQVRENYLKAFDAIVEQSLVDKEFDYIVRLYDELRQRIARQIPNRMDLHQSIAEHMDIVLFKQLLEHDHFKAEDLQQLMSYVFGWFERLQAPARDATTAAAKARVLGTIDGRHTFGQIVVAFLRTSHTVLDEIEADKVAFHAEMKKKKSA
jgi:hypothetical protein